MFKVARRQQPTLPESQTRAAWQLCSALLDYPTAEPARQPRRGRAGRRRPAARAGRRRSRGSSRHLRSADLRALQEEYVATFDHTRRCALYLTYFAYGDTRRRGVALVQFKQAYRKAGVEFDRATSCPTTCARCSSSGPVWTSAAAWRLLIDHRAGLEMLRLALADARLAVGTAWWRRCAPPCRCSQGEEQRRRTPADREGATRGGGRPRAVT